MVTIEIKSRSKSLKGLSTNDFGVESEVSDLIKLIATKNKTSIHRIRLTFLGKDNKQVPLNSDKTLKDNGFAKDSSAIELYIKDLGPQIGWRTVFIIEYLGPALIHPLFYYYYAYVQHVEHTQTQKIAMYWAVLHFVKRLYETVAVHKFSSATMPLFNIFKNSSHYWILSGFNLSFFLYGAPKSGWLKYIFHVNNFSDNIVYLLAALGLFAELSNFKTHLTLSNLRSGDSKAYVIPKGYGFDLVTCPNYFFESLGWFFYAILVGNWSAWVFLAVSFVQMWLWAIKKHKRLLKLYGDDYKKLRRTTIIPYLI